MSDPTKSGLAPYAAHHEDSAGRFLDEPESGLRSPFQRDRDRIIHARAFRRLKHKTQVFIFTEGDHYRTRLTHSLEVAQIARTLARALRLDEDLTEAVALAHDLGHPPFGHAGERALDEAMKDAGGFDHNAQSLSVVIHLERRYPAFDGLNLTWEVIEGIAKHNGPLASSGPVAAALAPLSQRFPLRLDRWPSAEAQVAAIADDIAYDAHDLDDGLRSGLLSLAQLADVPIAASILAGIRDDYRDLEAPRLTAELNRRLIGLLVEDVLDETGRRLVDGRPNATTPVVGFSPRMVEEEAGLKRFLRRHLYRHPMVQREADEAEQIILQLFDMMIHAPRASLEAWDIESGPAQARLVCDYIAGMTDRYALAIHAQLRG